MTMKYGEVTVYDWELEKAEKLTLNEIRNRIWLSVSCGQPIPGCISVEALRVELIRRNEEPIGYHNT